MKTWLVAAAATAALLGASAARADQPAGFYESLRLEPAASFVAGKPVKVWCATSQAVYREAAAAAQGASVDSIAWSVVGGTESFFFPRVCANLSAYLNKRRVVMDDYAVSLLTLAHEATHLTGLRDESATDCAALRAMPAMLRRFFPPRPGYTVHNVMAAAWIVHRREAAAYTQNC